MHSHNAQLNIPFCKKLNAESIALLQDMICETEHEIQGVVTTPSWYPMSQETLVAWRLTYLTESMSKSDKLVLWALALQTFDVEVHYKTGRLNVVADCLSRL